MKRILNVACVITTSLLVQNSFAQNALEVNQILGASNWGSSSSGGSSSSTSGTDVPIEAEPAMSVAASCSKSDQSFMPHNGFTNLMNGHKLNISHNADTGEITIDGGLMISNCNSMLQARVNPPSGDRPYLFNVEIKKPSGCSDLCTYEVDVAEDADAPGIKSGTKTIQVEPTYFGFLECLKQTGVISENKLQEDKIVKAPFKHVQSGLNVTGELAFYSKGPLAAQMAPKYGSFSGVKGGRCDSFEQITEKGFTIHSKEDITLARKQVLFDEICAGGDYKAIDKHLPDFEEFDSMYSILKNVRDSYLLEEVKSLHNLLKGDNYSGLDAERFESILSDFRDKIIVPLQDDISSLYSEYRSASSREARAVIQAEIDYKLKKLVQYVRAPYITDADQERMKSFAKKAPLQKDSWREAAVLAYANNITAFNFGKYGSDDALKEAGLNADTVAAIKASPKTSVLSTIKEIEDTVAIEREFIEQLGGLAADPKKSYAAEYSAAATSLQQEQAQLDQALVQHMQQQQMEMQQECLNPQKYWVTGLIQRNCVQRYQQSIQDAQLARQAAPQMFQERIQHYNSLATQWGQIESVRATGKGVQPNPRDIFQQQQQQQTMPQFSFQPWQGQNQQQMPGQYPQQQYPQQQFQQPGFQYQQQYQMNAGRMPGNYQSPYGQQGYPQRGYPQPGYQQQPGLPQQPSYGPGVYPSMPAPGQYPPGYQQQQGYPGSFQQNYQFQSRY